LRNFLGREASQSTPHDWENFSRVSSPLNVLWKTARELTYENFFQSNGLAPDATTYGTLLAVCARAGTWEKALELDAEIQRVFDKVRFHASPFSYLCNLMEYDVSDHVT